MPRQKGDKIQVWASLDESIYKEIERMAESERRKITHMTAILLENAIKERQRQRRKNGKGDD